MYPATLHTTPHPTTLHHTTLHHTPHHTTLHHTTPHHTTLHHTTLHYTTLHHTTLHYTTLHYTTRHDTTRHDTTLHYTTLHYTTLHYTTLHHTSTSFAITVLLAQTFINCQFPTWRFKLTGRVSSEVNARHEIWTLCANYFSLSSKLLHFLRWLFSWSIWFDLEWTSQRSLCPSKAAVRCKINPSDY